MLSDGEGKSATIELMEPVRSSINSLHVRVNSSSCFELLLIFLVLGVDV